jgi:hypothetical protein
MTRRKTLADLAYTASERYVRAMHGKDWRSDREQRLNIATSANGFFDGYLAGRRAERRAAKRRDG